MAELRKIRRSNPISQFSQVAPVSGVGFKMLGDMAAEAAAWLEPAAKEEQALLGQASGRRMAEAQAGANAVPAPSYGASGYAPGGLAGVGGMSRNEAMAAHGGPTNAAAAAMGGSEEREILAKTLQAEAGSEGYNGMLAAGAVIANRAAVGGYGDSVKGVIMKPGQFSAWNSVTGYAGGEQGQNMSKMRPSKDAYAAADAILSGQYEDPTGGATHYYNPSISTPKWGKGNGGQWKRIGNHIFGNADAGRSAEEVLAARGKSPPKEPTVSTSGPKGDIEAEAPVYVPAPSPPPTAIRTSAGTTEERRYSPLSGPVLQAHRAAQGMAFLAGIQNQAAVDVMNLSREFEGNPQGFSEAMKGYVDQQVSTAPPDLKEDLRASLTEAGQRRYLGMMDEQQRDVRRRADNESRAYVSRLSDDYAEALATGRTEDAARARTQLESILYAREQMPGIAWTRAQSENIILDAMDSAKKLTASRQKAQNDEMKDDLKEVIHALDNGRVSDKEGIVSDPAVQAAHPDLAQEAAGKMLMREAQPGFMSATPGQMKEMIESERARPVGAQWQTDLLDTMEKWRKAAVRELDEDPIAFAQKHHSEKPPELPTGEELMEDPGSLTKALTERRAYAEGLMEAGYTDQVVILSDAERKAFSPVFNADAPVEGKVVMAQALASTLGPHTAKVLESLGADPVMAFGGQMMAATGDMGLVIEAMTGRERMNANQVDFPENRSRMVEFLPEGDVAFQGVAGGSKVQERIMDFAAALYAANSAGVTEREAQKQLMAQSIQRAMGQRKGVNGKTYGGVQEVFGNGTLLPVEVSGEKFEKTVRTMLGLGAMIDIDKLKEMTGGSGNFLQDASVNGKAPVFGGQPFASGMLTDENFRMVSMGGTKYRIEHKPSQSDVETPDGAVFLFDIMDFLEAAP